MSINQHHIETINAALSEVGDNLREFKSSHEEIKARLQAAEQLLVRHADGDGFSLAGHRPLSADAVEQLVDQSAFAHLKAGNVGTARVHLNASIRAALTNDGAGSSNDGTMPNQPERRGIVGQVLKPLTLLEALPSRPVSSDSVEFVRLNSDDDAAEQGLEGDEKQNLDFEGVLVKIDIRTFAGHTTASRQVLSDHRQLQQVVGRTLSGKSLSKFENAIVNGTDGLLDVGTAFVPVLPIVARTAADSIGECVAEMEADGYHSDIVIMHPADWLLIQSFKTQTSEYLFGSPVTPLAPSIWSSRVVKSSHVPEGTAIVLDSSFVTVLDREQASVMTSNSHKDYFTRNLVLVLAETRGAVEITDAAAVRIVDLDAEPASE